MFGNSAFEQTFASVAQLVEQGTENPRVVGSIPTGSTSRISCDGMLVSGLYSGQVNASAMTTVNMRI